VGVFHRFASQNRKTSLCEWLEYNFATKRAKNRQVFGRDGRDNTTWHLKLDGQQSRPHQNGAGATALQDVGVASQTPSDSRSQNAIENRGTTYE
jgi:hypothetical protein